MIAYDFENFLFHFRKFCAAFLLIENFSDFCVRHIAGDDHRSLQIQAGLDRILREVGEDFFHRAIQINFYRRSQVHHIACGDILFRMMFHLFEPETVFVNFRFDVTVCRAAYTDRNRATCRMTRATDNADIVDKIFAAELCADASLLANVQHLFFHFEVAENASAFRTGRRNIIQVTAACELHHVRIHFGACATDNNCQMIRRARCRSEGFHLIGEEFFQRLRVEERLRHRPVISFIRRSTTLCHKEEFHFGAFFGVNVDLSRQIASGIFFFIHRKRSDLTVTQILRRVRIVNAFGNRFGIVKACPHLLAFMRNANSGSRILTERKNSLGGNGCVFEHRQCDEFIVIARFGILQNFCHFCRVRWAQAKFDFFKSGFRKLRKRFFRNFQNFLSFEFSDGNSVFAEIHIFSRIFAVLDCCFVLKCHRNLSFK